MIKEDAKLRWSNVRDAIYGKLTNLRTVVKDEGTNFIITGDLKSENLILHHGKTNYFLSPSSRCRFTITTLIKKISTLLCNNDLKSLWLTVQCIYLIVCSSSRHLSKSLWLTVQCIYLIVCSSSCHLSKSLWLTVQCIYLIVCSSSRHLSKSLWLTVQCIYLIVCSSSRHLGIQNINSHNISYGQTYVSIKKLKYYDRNQSCIITFTDGNICLFDLNNLTQEIYKCQQAIYDLTVAEKYKKFITLCRDNSLRVSR